MNKDFDLGKWIKDIVPKLNSLNNDIYYDDNGVVRSYENALKKQKKTAPKIYKEKKQMFEKMQKLREDYPEPFKIFFEELNHVEKRQIEFEAMMEQRDIRQSYEHLQDMKHIVLLSKLFNDILHQVPLSSKTKKTLERMEKFQLRFEPTLDLVKESLDEKLKDSDQKDEQYK